MHRAAVRISACILLWCASYGWGDPESGLLNVVNRVRREVESIRERRFPRGEKLHTRILGPKEIAAYVRKELNEELPPPLLEFRAAVYREFDLIPPAADLKEILLGVLGAQVAGFYDPRRKTFFIAEKLSGLREMIAAHELTHALQDRYVNLDAVLHLEDLGFARGGAVLNDDISLARLSFFEGEAQLVMTRYMERSGPVPSLSLRDWTAAFLSEVQLAAVPPVVAHELMFPYTEGLAFVSALHAKGGWKLVNEAYRRLPRSTEQVMHPEKYFAREDPVFVSLEGIAALRASGWRLAGETSLGEFMTGEIVRFLAGDFVKGMRAAGGWGGDTLCLLRKGKACILAWYTTWDTPKEADEFNRFFREGYERARSGNILRKTSSEIILRQGKTYRLIRRMNEKDVLYVSTTEPKAALRPEAWIGRARKLSWEDRFSPPPAGGKKHRDAKESKEKHTIEKRRSR